ncbi:ATP-binding protein [Novosphingobium sp.]|uniref:sensor histidine kinase n=1 Tax=Novosphingobium sp. TaxID=1874826 RepID=UPI003B529449
MTFTINVWRRSAALRLSLAYSACMALGVIVLGAATFWSMHVAFVRQIDVRLADEAATLTQDYRSGGLPELREAIATREALHQLQAPLYALYGAQGTRIAGRMVAAEPVPGRGDIRFIDPVEGDDVARAVTSDLGKGLRLAVAVDREQIEMIDQTLLTAFGLALLGVVLLGAGGALLFSTLLRNRLGRLAASAEAIAAGAVSGRMPVGPHGDEFDTLAASLNHMLARIANLIENLRQVSGAIAHDLRTPLTRLRHRLESARNAGDLAQAQGSITFALGQLDEVLALFAAILHVSEVESGVAIPIGSVDLSALAVELAESYEPAILAGGRTLEWRIEPGVTLTGTRELLAQALSNLVENAICHTPANSKLMIMLRHGPDAIVLSVQDDGPGIAAADRDRVLRRFERLDPTRSRPGFGLGLTLVDAVAHRHGGQLVLDDAKPGLIAALTFYPANQSNGV